MTEVDAPIASLSGISKRYPGVQALSDIAFSVSRGEVRALIGKNGAGKSTLIRMLAGAEAPDEGAVTIGGAPLDRGGVQRAFELGVRTVYQELTLIPQMTVAENLFMGSWPVRRLQLDRRRMETDARQALDTLGLNINPSVSVEELSIADRQMVEIARALYGQPSLLILDEPTSSLSAAEVDRVMAAVRTIKKSGVAVIYVSHRLDEIRRVADSATIIRDGRIVQTAPVAGMSTADVVAMMLGAAAAHAPNIASAPVPGPTLIEVANVALAPKLVDVSLQVHAGEVLGIAGILASGRTELLQIMAGLRRPDRGTVVANGQHIEGRGLRHALGVGIGITPEDRKNDGVVPELGVDENIVMTAWGSVTTAGVIDRSRLAAAAGKVIEAMSIQTARQSTPVGTLSGGNQQKVVIGRWLHAGSQIMLLDEPTRGVDVGAKAQIYELLREMAEAGQAVVFVSSEIEELNLVCDRVLVLSGGRIVAEQVAPNIETDKLLIAALEGL